MDTGKFSLNSCLCNVEKMLEEENTSLINFGLPHSDISKEQYIQNYLMDHYVANEDDFTPEKAKVLFDANHPKLNQDQKSF